MAKQIWKGSAQLSPVPCVLVTSGTVEKPNVFTVGWTGIVCTHPPRTYVSIRPSRYSYGLIKESGEKNSAIYNRANIDRRHFSKICNHKNYQPSKLTVLAFAIALKLDFEQTQELLAAAGYTLTKNNLADIIISFFIEKKIFDVDVVNNYLYDYEQPLLGG